MTTAGFDTDPGVRPLREWLDGDWAIFFSNPEDFAPHPSTPAGFHAQIAALLAEQRVKPFALATSAHEPGHRWLRDVTGAQARVRVTGNTRTGGSVIDFIGCALEARLRSLDPPYVVVIDPAGRCRLTILYQRYRTDRPRTLEELLCIVKALRDGGTSRSTVDDRTRAQQTKALRNSGRD